MNETEIKDAIFAGLRKIAPESEPASLRPDQNIRETLDVDGIVVDIGLATQVLREELAALNFRNLDEEPQFKGRNTTTEFLARLIFDRVAARMAAGALGANALPSAQSAGVQHMRVTLNESHVAWASYEGAVPVRAPA